MPSPKICGIETEFGIFARGADISPMTASSLLVNAWSDRGLALRAWDFSDEHPDHADSEGWRPEADYPEVEMLMANTVLTNGSRYYVDHAHPEVSTPECVSPRQAVLYDRAAEEIVRGSLRRANGRLGRGIELVAHKNNSDGKGNSYGCHENYLVSRAVPFPRIVDCLTTHFVTRQVYTGAGKVGTENLREDEEPVAFQLSQRADFFEERVGLETTVRRPIINTRDEPHCDPDTWRRLHVIVGDANMSETATWLKLGTTAIVLAMLEDDAFPTNLTVTDPVTEMRRVSHDVTLGHRVHLVDGRMLDAITVQRTILTAAQQWRRTVSVDPLGGDTDDILTLWQSTLDALDRDPMELADRIDWVAKKRIIDAMADRHGLEPGHARLRAIDLQYHDLDAERCLARRIGLQRMFTDAEVADAVSSPPRGTRAFFRGECIRLFGDRISSANWDNIVFDTGIDGLQRVPTRDPLKGTAAHVEALLSSVRDVRGLLDALGDDAVEPVSDDPGW